MGAAAARLTMGSFTDQLNKAVAQAQGRIDEVAKTTVVLIAQQLVQRSPVGNPDIWKANALPSARRETYNTAVDAYNAETGGKVRKKGVKNLRKSFPNKAGQGYTGGRFRANWQIGIGSMDTTTTEATDAGGSATIARLEGEAQGVKAGQVVTVSNSLPYAQRLEVGWSKQAPAGMVRLTVVDLPGLMAQYLSTLKD